MKKRTASLRKPGENKAGAQNNHPVSTLEMVDAPEEAIVHPVGGGCNCGKCLDGAKRRYWERRQVTNIEVRRKITGHQVEIAECGCGEQWEAECPYSAPVQ